MTEKLNTEIWPTTLIGPISINSRGVGYFKTDLYPEDILIEPNLLKTAMHKDEVEISIFVRREHEHYKGQVNKIISRSKMRYVGTVEKTPTTCVVIPDDKRLYVNITLSELDSSELYTGQKLLVEITKWDDPKKLPEGNIITIIGKKGDHNVEMESIVLERGFDYVFDKKIEEEAHKLKEIWSDPDKISAEISKRKDFRDTTTFTIDPDDAKDFDDAISVKKLPSGNYEIGVHIADVSNFVIEDTALDIEARKRAFSVYLVDRTIPMLPEILSNELCSLNPNETKFTFSSVFEITPEASVVKRWFGRTVIKSDKRFTYKEAQDILDAKAGLLYDELSILDSISKKLKKLNYESGAIEFHSEEVKFILDEEGHPIKIYKKALLDTNKLVEQFMLLANREVAELIYNAGEKNTPKINWPFIYRIHDVPDREKISNLSIFLKALGYELPVSKDGEISAKDINILMQKIEGKAEESLIKTATVRSMSKAIYSTKNIGHFGLSFQYYAHFTSPIRRYPDLIVHRVLATFLNGMRLSQNSAIQFEKIANESSEREIKAADAERTSIKLKQVEYMMTRKGEVFDGIISGVTEWGIYVEEINTKCEGMIKLRDIPGDFYMLDEKTYSVVGEKNKKRFSIGQPVKIKVVNTDLEKKIIDFVLV